MTGVAHVPVLSRVFSTVLALRPSRTLTFGPLYLWYLEVFSLINIFFPHSLTGLPYRFCTSLTSPVPEGLLHNWKHPVTVFSLSSFGSPATGYPFYSGFLRQKSSKSWGRTLRRDPKVFDSRSSGSRTPLPSTPTTRPGRDTYVGPHPYTSFVLATPPGVTSLRFMGTSPVGPRHRLCA